MPLMLKERRLRHRWELSLPTKRLVGLQKGIFALEPSEMLQLRVGEITVNGSIVTGQTRAGSASHVASTDTVTVWTLPTFVRESVAAVGLLGVAPAASET